MSNQIQSSSSFEVLQLIVNTDAQNWLREKREILFVNKKFLIIFEFNSNAEHTTMCETYLWKCQKSSFLFLSFHLHVRISHRAIFFYIYMVKWCGKVRSNEEVGSDLNTFKPVSNSSSFSQHVWKFFFQQKLLSVSITSEKLILKTHLGNLVSLV